MTIIIFLKNDFTEISQNLLYLTMNKEWITLRGNYARTGTPEAETQGQGTNWKIEIPTEEIYSGPLVYKDKIYFIAEDGYLYCLNAQTGKQLWKFNIGITSISRSEPAIAEDRIYIATASWQGDLLCLDANNGELLWEQETEEKITAPIAVAHGKIFVGNWDKKFHIFDALTGKHLKTIKTKGRSPSGVDSGAVIYDELVFFGATDKHLYCLDVHKFKTKWKFKAQEEIRSTPTVHQDKIYFTCDEYLLYCLDIRTGTLMWEKKVAENRQSPVVVNNTIYFIADTSNKLVAMDTHSQEIYWAQTLEKYITTNLAYADGKLFFGNADAHIYCVEAETGKILWKRKAGISDRTPAIYKGSLYAIVENGGKISLVCLSVD